MVCCEIRVDLSGFFCSIELLDSCRMYLGHVVS